LRFVLVLVEWSGREQSDDNARWIFSQDSVIIRRPPGEPRTSRLLLTVDGSRRLDITISRQSRDLKR
jgi:hypothetical protein